MSKEIHLASLNFAAIFLLWQEKEAAGAMPAQEMGTVTVAPFLPPKLAPCLAISCCKIHAARLYHIADIAQIQCSAQAARLQ